MTDNNTPEQKQTETSTTVINDAMAAKNKDRPGYIFDIKDKKTSEVTETLFDCSKYSTYLSQTFNIKNFKGMLYIYDSSKKIYKQQENELNTHIRNNYIKWNVSKPLQSWLREMESHIKSMGNEDEYPFNTSTDTIPVTNGIIKINYDMKMGFECDDVSIVKETELGIIKTPKPRVYKYITLLPHGPEHLFTYKLSVVYNPKADPTKAVDLLEQWVDQPNSLLQIPAQAILQTQHGHSYKKAHLLQGEPHAGKTSFITLLYKLFPQEFTEAIRLQQVCEDRFVGGNLEGKLLNMYDDLEDLPLNTIEPFKTLTGSCTHGIERKYEKHYTGRVTAVHVFSCNYPPEYPEKVKRDSAFWERWEYIKFPYSYPVDPNFYEKVYTDDMVASFFNAILLAAIKIRKSGLLVKSDVQEVMTNWSINSDPLFEFVTWGFGRNDGKTNNNYSKKKLYDYYIDFCNSHNTPEHKRKNTLKAFTTSLQPHGFLPVRLRSKGENHEVFTTTVYKNNPSNLPDLDYAIKSQTDLQ
jgi:putative DNA primase/helicase